mgnify:CR=1 FL=1
MMDLRGRIPTPGERAAELVAERDKLQRQVFHLLNEKHRMGYREGIGDYWRWRRDFDEARSRLQQFDNLHGTA